MLSRFPTTVALAILQIAFASSVASADSSANGTPANGAPSNGVPTNGALSNGFPANVRQFSPAAQMPVGGKPNASQTSAPADPNPLSCKLGNSFPATTRAVITNNGTVALAAGTRIALAFEPGNSLTNEAQIMFRLVSPLAPKSNTAWQSLVGQLHGFYRSCTATLA